MTTENMTTNETETEEYLWDEDHPFVIAYAEHNRKTDWIGIPLVMLFGPFGLLYANAGVAIFVIIVAWFLGAGWWPIMHFISGALSVFLVMYHNWNMVETARTMENLDEIVAQYGDDE
jgi:hypothetical protein